MWKNFVRIFDEVGVTNVVWIMDYSVNVRHNLDAAIALWPEDNVVQWLFHNLFQFTPLDFGDNKGDCPTLLKLIYDNFEASFADVPAWKDIPWGLGAWGSNDTYWSGVIPQADREDCINSVREDLEGGQYSRYKAAVYFNSLESRIDKERSPEMLPTFKKYLESSAFYDPDKTRE